MVRMSDWLSQGLFTSGWVTAQDAQSYLGGDDLCNSARIGHPDIWGLRILETTAVNVQNHTFPANPQVGLHQGFEGLYFCNVTVTYTHPGWDDQVKVTVYLPSEGWNGRFLGTGGGGYVTGGESLVLLYMAPGVADGFAVATTDGGHSDSLGVMSGVGDWALSSPGNVNWPLFMDFASVALHDMANVGKAITESFYGTPPSPSYFAGCSTGGRQGLMLAQRYPKDFDGILAVFPAINWAHFIVAEYWPQFVMNRLGQYPKPCELSAMTAAAVEACDDLDGVVDGIISSAALCSFDPHTMVGKAVDCDGEKVLISTAAAYAAEAAWSGPQSSAGKPQWYGVSKDTDLGVKGPGLASTSCDEEGNCTGRPFTIPVDWIRYWLKKDPTFDVSKMTHDDWDYLFHDSVNQFDSIIGTADPDLSEFRKAGGKMLTWHGLRDALIPCSGTTNYYDRVLELDPDAAEYYRLFMVPGAGHDLNDGPTPKALTSTIMKWVEEGVAPDTLLGVGKDGRGQEVERPLCMYPRVQVYKSGKPSLASSFACE